jgi:hypothetical protein
MLCAVEKPKLRLDGTQVMVDLHRLTCFSEGRRMIGQKLSIGSRSLSLSVPSPIATTSIVFHELMQQLNLLIP